MDVVQLDRLDAVLDRIVRRVEGEHVPVRMRIGRLPVYRPGGSVHELGP